MPLTPDKDGIVARVGWQVVTPAGLAYIIDIPHPSTTALVTVALVPSGEHRTFLLEQLVDGP